MPENSKEGSNQLSTESITQKTSDETKEQESLDLRKENSGIGKSEPEEALFGGEAASAREGDEVATHSNTPGRAPLEGGNEFDSNSHLEERESDFKKSIQHTPVWNTEKLEGEGSPLEESKMEENTPIEKSKEEPEPPKEDEQAPSVNEECTLSRKRRRKEKRHEKPRKRPKLEEEELHLDEEDSEDSCRFS